MERATYSAVLEQSRKPILGEKEFELSESQRAVAEIAFFGTFLKKCNENAKEQTPWLQTKESGSAKDIKNLHVIGLLDAYISLPLGENGRKKFEVNWGGKSDYLKGQVKHMLPALEEEREKIFTEAKVWNPKDERREIRKTYSTLAKLPKEQRELLYERTGLESEKLTTKTTRWGVTIGVNVGSMYALDGVASAVGVGTVWATDKFAHVASDNPHAIENIPLPALLPVLGASYAAWWYGGMRQNLEQNWQLLEETGVSTSALSKFMYDRAMKKQSTEKKRKLASKVGYVGLELGKEWPYYTAAFGAAALTKVSPQESMIFLAGANLGAAAYEAGLAYATNRFLKAKNIFERRKAVDGRK